MKYFLIKDYEGDNYVMWEGDNTPPYNEDFGLPIEIPRMPSEHEHWDTSTNSFVCNQKALIDETYGQAAIAAAHARKAIEADMILSGVSLPKGMLAAEAEATGQDILELAKIVANKSKSIVEAEIERIVAKREV